MNFTSKEKLLKEFLTKAQVASAKVGLIQKDAHFLCSALEKLIASEKEVLFVPSDNIESELFKEFATNEKIIINPEGKHLVSIKTGITCASYGIASTGSVVIPIENNLAIYVSMLAKKHIVIIESDKILPRPRDIFNRNYSDQDDLKRSFSIITGSSATADMGALVRGVHGPGELFIIVLGNNYE